MELLMEDFVSARIRKLLDRSPEKAEDAFGEALHICFHNYDAVSQAYLFTARTEAWMRNIDGVVHGGFCAAIADHAMGIVAYCSKEGDCVAPTIQLQIAYHRPLPPEEEVLVRVRPISVTSKLIHLSAEVCRMQQPENVYFSATATFYCRG